MTAIAFGSPGRYIQGPGEIDRLALHAQPYGSHVFAVIDTFFYDTMTEKLSRQFRERNCDFASVCFEGEITAEKIDGLARTAQDGQAEVVIGIGGGKTLDTAKAVGSGIGAPIIIIPTTASTDAPHQRHVRHLQ